MEDCGEGRTERAVAPLRRLPSPSEQMSISTDQRFAAVGSWVLILWGIGHNVVIDILPLVFGVYLYDVDSTVLALMRQSIFRFPLTGQTTAYLAFYGLSVWLGISLILVGLLNLVIVRSDGIGRRSRRLIYALDVVLATVFLIIAAICFFAVPVAGGLLALVMFLLAYLRC